LSKCKGFGPPPYRCRLRIWPPICVHCAAPQCHCIRRHTSRWLCNLGRGV